jgi:hypothetical protein
MARSFWTKSVRLRFSPPSSSVLSLSGILPSGSSFRLGFLGLLRGRVGILADTLSPLTGVSFGYVQALYSG